MTGLFVHQYITFICLEYVQHFKGLLLMKHDITTKGQLYAFVKLTRRALLKRQLLGKRRDLGRKLMITVKARNWLGCRVEEQDSFVLCGCTVSPRFDFNDFELSERDILIGKYTER